MMKALSGIIMKAVKGVFLGFLGSVVGEEISVSHVLYVDDML